MTCSSAHASLRWLGVVLSTLAAVLITVFGAATASAAASAPPSPAQTFSEAHTQRVQIVLEPHDDIGAGEQLGRKFSSYDSALATGVAGENLIANSPRLQLEGIYDGAVPDYDTSVLFFDARTVVQVEAVGRHANPVCGQGRSGAVLPSCAPGPTCVI